MANTIRTFVSDDRSIYILPGKGGRLNQGLGAELNSRGYDVFGREIVGEFQKLPFQDQVEIVANDLKSGFWHKNAKVIANSYGAYLFLHAQAIISSFIGRVLLLSPIVGEAANEVKMVFFVPPGARRLNDLVAGSTYPIPKCCKVHVGELDWQSDPVKVKTLAERLSMELFIVPNNGHRLDHSYVSCVLDRWLNNDCCNIQQDDANKS